MTERLIESVHFGPDAVQIVYMETTDIRQLAGVPVTMTRTLVVPRDVGPYVDEIVSIWDDLIDLVGEVASDHADAQPWQPPDADDEEEDEDEGMGSG